MRNFRKNFCDGDGFEKLGQNGGKVGGVGFDK